MNKRIVSELLLCALTASLTASCGGGGSPEQTEAASSETAETTESIPSLVGFDREDNGGRTFTIYGNSYKSYEYDAEELTGDVVSDAVYMKNQAVEEYLGIDLTFVWEPGNINESSVFNQKIMQDVASGDGVYDLVTNTLVCTLPIASEGYFLESGALEWCDFDHPWWIRDMKERFSIAGKLYGFLGDASLSVYKDISVIYFNKRIWEEYGAPDPYTMVREGTWTFDRFHELASSMGRDLNGDGKWEFGVDQMTFVAEGVPNGTFHTSLDLRVLDFESDGTPVWLGLTERLADAYEKHRTFMSGDGVVSLYTIDDNSLRTMKTFAEGSVAAMVNFLYATESMRDMKDDYGIIPLPKYDEDQKNYISQLGTSTTMLHVPVTAKAPALTSKVMELLSFYTNRLVVPKYYEVALKEKYARDADIAEMLDIVREGATIDFLFVYFISLQNSPNTYFRFVDKTTADAKPVGTDALASDFEGKKTSFMGSLNELIEKYRSLES